MSAKAIIRMPGEAKGVTLSGQPMAFLVTGEHTKHTSMFDWTLPAHFSTGLHVHRVLEETFYCCKLLQVYVHVLRWLYPLKS